jgi:hypothetical protein
MDKTILLASFLFPERLDWFMTYLETKFNISRNKVFCYKNLDDESKIIVTFKIILSENKHLDLKNLFPNAIIIHKKGNALYTINALNKLIEENLGDTIGNIDYKSHRINWDEYQNKLILIDNKELKLMNIKRIF